MPRVGSISSFYFSLPRRSQVPLAFVAGFSGWELWHVSHGESEAGHKMRRSPTSGFSPRPWGSQGIDSRVGCLLGHQGPWAQAPPRALLLQPVALLPWWSFVSHCWPLFVINHSSLLWMIGCMELSTPTKVDPASVGWTHCNFPAEVGHGFLLCFYLPLPHTFGGILLTAW